MPYTRRDTGSLSYNELVFAYEYVLCRFNATEAYYRAFDCSRRTAATQGCKLANSTKVRRFIDQIIMKPIYSKYQVSAQRIIEELASVGFSNVADVAEIEDGQLRINDTIDNDDRANAAISEISVIGGKTNLKMHDKVKALQLLGKYHGMEMEFNQIVMGLQQYGYQVIQDAETGELQLKSMRRRAIPFDMGDHVIRDVVNTTTAVEEINDGLRGIENNPGVDQYLPNGEVVGEFADEDNAMESIPLEYTIPEDKEQHLEELEQKVEQYQVEAERKIIRSNPFK